MGEGEQRSRIAFLRRPLLLDAIIAVFILFTGWVFTFQIEQFLDIGLYDESIYLRRGVSLPVSGFPLAQDAPLYASWYYLLSLFQPDRVELYYLNFKAMTVLPALLWFLFLRINHIPRLVAVSVSLLFLMSSANFITWPKVSHFGIMVLFLGLILSSLLKTPIAKLSVAIVFVLLASYARPEFFLAFLGLSILAGLLVFRAFRQERLRSVRLPMFLTVMLCLALLLYLGLPMGSGNRDMMAFGQHYSLNWVGWTGADLNPWTNWETIVQKDFGDVTSPLGAFASNPSAFLRHVYSNLHQIVPRLHLVFFHGFPGGSQSTLAAAVLIVFIAATVLLTNRKFLVSRLQKIRENGKESLLLLGILAVLLLPSLVSVVALYPRDHYLLILVLLSISAVLVVLLRDITSPQSILHNMGTILICIVVVALLRPISTEVMAQKQPNLEVIMFLKSLTITEPVRILEAEGGYGIYVGDNYTRIAEYDKESGFSSFLKKYPINVIVLSDGLRNDTRFKDDAEWVAFLDNPGSEDFVSLDVPALENRNILVKESLLNHDLFIEQAMIVNTGLNKHPFQRNKMALPDRAPSARTLQKTL